MSNNLARKAQHWKIGVNSNMSIIAVWSQSLKIRLPLRDADIVLKQTWRKVEVKFLLASLSSPDLTLILFYLFLLILFSPFLLHLVLYSPFPLNSHFLASLVEIYRTFLLALVPCKHGFPCHNLFCMREDLLSVSSTKHSPPRSSGTFAPHSEVSLGARILPAHAAVYFSAIPLCPCFWKVF